MTIQEKLNKRKAIIVESGKRIAKKIRENEKRALKSMEYAKRTIVR